jgi:hypothetical protein
MSEITSIYDALEAKSVTTTGGDTPDVYDLDELKNSIPSSDLPIRLLLPVGDDTKGDGRSGVFIAIGTTMAIDWQVNDLMLWQPLGQGEGLREYAPELVDYCGKYLDAMRTFKCPTNNSSLTDVYMSPGIYEWPMGSGVMYAGVLCQLTIKEVLSG